MRLATLCGSLRKASINARLLEAIRISAPTGIHVKPPPKLGELPLFNPDTEDEPPECVIRLWELIETSDAIIIASPEYAHGITGVLKNALDWTVARGSFMAKPVAVLNAAPRSWIAHRALVEVITTIDAKPIEEASIGIPVLGNTLDAGELTRDPQFSALIQGVLTAIDMTVHADKA